MLTRNGLFILIAVYFIFTYPMIVSSWSLNDSIGWGVRPWATYLFPLWFMLAYLTYKELATKKIVVSNLFFWSHVLITIVPTLFINYPFTIIRNNWLEVHIQNPIDKIFRFNQYVWLYFFLQIVFYVVILWKLIKGIPAKV